MSWKEECDTIHSEMDRLLTAGWPETAEERQVCKIQFMALIERRNVSAQKFLKPDGETATLSIRRQQPSKAPEPPNHDPTSDLEITNVKISQKGLGAGHAIDPDLQPPPADPRLRARNFLKSLGLE
jgi:hypothetical protein